MSNKKESIEKDDESFSQAYLKKFNEGFSQAYLTIISIIQGVAFAVLGTQTFYAYINTESTLKALLYSANSFMLIIIVSYSYTLLVIVFRWPLTIRDFIVPYALGFFELAIMFNICKNQWWLWNAIFCIIGFVAFLNSSYNVEYHKEHMPFMNKTNKIVKERLSFNMKLSLIASLMASIIYLINFFILNIIFEYLSLIVYFLMLIILIYKTDIYSNKLYESIKNEMQNG